MEVSCLCSSSDPVTFLTDPIPLPCTSFSHTFCLLYSPHSPLPVKISYRLSPLKNSLSLSPLTSFPAAFSLLFNSLFTFLFVIYSNSLTGVHLFQHHSYSAYCTWQQKFRCSAADLLLDRWRARALISRATALLLLSASGYSMTQLVSETCFTGTSLPVQDQKAPHNSKLFTCLFCFVAFSSRTRAPSCLTCTVPASLWAGCTTSDISWISFFGFFLGHGFKIQPSLSSHIIKILYCTLKPSNPVTDTPFSLVWCNPIQNDAECQLKRLLQEAFASCPDHAVHLCNSLLPLLFPFLFYFLLSHKKKINLIPQPSCSAPNLHAILLKTLPPTTGLFWRHLHPLHFQKNVFVPSLVELFMLGRDSL